MNEDTNNSFDFNSLLKEMQTLNEGTISNGERLDQISEFLIAKDKEEKEEKELQEKLKKEQEEKDLQDQTEQQTKTAEETETYTEILSDIRDQAVLTNNILAGQIFFTGMLFGLVLLTVLWNRFIR